MKIIGLLLLLAGTWVSGRAKAACQKAPDSHLKVLTLNLQINTSRFQVAPWKIRSRMIAGLLKDESVAVAGFQEALAPMMSDLAALLPEYAVLGVGRDDGKQEGEHSPLFYRKDRLEVLKSGHFWLSPTPQVPGSRGWDAWSPRVVTWALFKDLKNRQTFYIYNTHYDHWGTEARRQSSELIAQHVKRNLEGYPSIVLADMNAKAKSDEYRILLAKSGMMDARYAGPHEGPDWTYSFFGWKKSKIDYVFITSGIQVCRHSIIPDDPQMSHRKSDHLPVAAELEL